MAPCIKASWQISMMLIPWLLKIWTYENLPISKIFLFKQCHMLNRAQIQGLVGQEPDFIPGALLMQLFFCWKHTFVMVWIINSWNSLSSIPKGFSLSYTLSIWYAISVMHTSRTYRPKFPLLTFSVTAINNMDIPTFHLLLAPQSFYSRLKI